MDTIVLVLQKEQYEVTDSTRFKDNFEPLNSLDYYNRDSFIKKHKGVRKYVQNAPILFRKEGLVHPQLTIYERLRGSNYSCDLHIRVSLSKLLYGHSFLDLYTDQLNIVRDLLVARLKDMAVIVSKEALQQAQVNTMHYSVNLDFPSEQHCRMFLDRLNKVSIGNWLEKNTRAYSNDGHAVRFHSSIFQIVFYLKYYDLFETKSRRIDRHVTMQEEQVAKKIKESGVIPPVVRFEIRFAGKRSVTKHLNTILALEKKVWLFNEVFSSAYSRKVLLYYWNKILDDPINHNLLCGFSAQDVCRLALDKYKQGKLQTVFAGLGIFYLLHSLGLKDTRELVQSRQSCATWYRERRKIATFVHRYVKENTELIDIVTKALKNTEKQLKLYND